MNRSHLPNLLLSLAAACALAACDSAAPAHEPGTLVVSLDAVPGGADRALKLSITGPAQAGAVTSAMPQYTVYSRAAAGTTTAAVFGVITPGDLLRISVPDVTQARQYAATVEEAADSANVARAAPAGFTVRVRAEGKK